MVTDRENCIAVVIIYLCDEQAVLAVAKVFKFKPACVIGHGKRDQGGIFLFQQTYCR